MFLIILNGCLNLGINRIAIDIHKRHHAVRCSAGDDLNLAHILKFLESVNKILAVFIDESVINATQLAAVHLSSLVKFCIACSLQLLVRQLDQFIEISDKSVLQQRITEHLAQRRRNRHRNSEINIVIDETLKHIEQWNISLDNRFVEPSLFQERIILRVSDERQVSMQLQTYISVCHEYSYLMLKFSTIILYNIFLKFQKEI